MKSCVKLIVIASCFGILSIGALASNTYLYSAVQCKDVQNYLVNDGITPDGSTFLPSGVSCFFHMTGDSKGNIFGDANFDIGNPVSNQKATNYLYGFNTKDPSKITMIVPKWKRGENDYTPFPGDFYNIIDVNDKLYITALSGGCTRIWEYNIPDLNNASVQESEVLSLKPVGDDLNFQHPLDMPAVPSAITVDKNNFTYVAFSGGSEEQQYPGLNSLARYSPNKTTLQDDDLVYKLDKKSIVSKIILYEGDVYVIDDIETDGRASLKKLYPTTEGKPEWKYPDTVFDAGPGNTIDDIAIDKRGNSYLSVYNRNGDYSTVYKYKAFPPKTEDLVSEISLKDEKIRDTSLVTLSDN